MLSSLNPVKTKAWKQLACHAEQMKKQHMKKLFESDSRRAERFSINFGDMLFDYSKNIINEETFSLLMKLARETKLKDAVEKMFSGKKINETENRAVLHTALRGKPEDKFIVDGQNVMPYVMETKQKMRSFSEHFINGEMKGFTGKTLDTVVNIGIGGSDLGPLMVTEALRPYRNKKVFSYFVSNVDGAHISSVLEKCNPETTLFMIASKSFKTTETMTNAETARTWFFENGGNKSDVCSHFVAISANKKKAAAFGIHEENVFTFRDWVGGRYSLWSAIGLSIACTIGFDNYEKLLSGAKKMDEHFQTQPFEKNIPVIMALLGIWYTNFMDAETHAIIPYSQDMHRFSAYFQQGDMESNGKSVDRSGNPVACNTGPVIWGEPGTNSQHAFFQLIHQGTRTIPCDFLAAATAPDEIEKHHKQLLANFLAQTEALMKGKTEKEAADELKKENLHPDKLKRLLPFKVFKGNNPTNSFLFKTLDPETLGSLIAMYEHKIFVQGVIWNIFSFDQWGVELGKQLAKEILPELNSKKEILSHDSSTNNLINRCRKMRNKKSSGDS